MQHRKSNRTIRRAPRDLSFRDTEVSLEEKEGITWPGKKRLKGDSGNGNLVTSI
jgi:hypothetical protein